MYRVVLLAFIAFEVRTAASAAAAAAVLLPHTRDNVVDSQQHGCRLRTARARHATRTGGAEMCSSGARCVAVFQNVCMAAHMRWTVTGLASVAFVSAEIVLRTT